MSHSCRSLFCRDNVSYRSEQNNTASRWLKRRESTPCGASRTWRRIASIMGWRCGACHAATADAPSFGSRDECARPVPSVRPVRLRRGIDEWWPTAEAGAAGACGWEKERDTNQSYRHRMHIMCWGAPPRRRCLLCAWESGELMERICLESSTGWWSAGRQASKEGLFFVTCKHSCNHVQRS